MNSHVDTTEITHISLCAGYGGIDLGLRKVLPNLRTIAYSEVEAFAVENLLARMEGGKLDPAPVWSDLRTFPWDQFSGLVDIISGGFPCQPFSSAGKRAGDEDERHLFPYILEGIKRCRPAIVFLENVEGIISAKLAGDNWRDPAGTPVLLHVFRELERVGYRPTAGIFSAAECGAPHQRKRIFILAVADTFPEGLQGSLRQSRDSGGVQQQAGRSGDCVWPSRPGQPQHAWEPPRVVGDTERAERGKISAGGNISNGNDAGREEETDRTGAASKLGNASSDGRQHDQQSEDGRQAGAVAKSGAGFHPERWQTESTLGGDTYGTVGGLDYAKLCESCDNRTDELRLLGNGVVPQVAALAFQTLINQ